MNRGDQSKGRSQWRFSVFAQDERGELGCADVDVKLQDIDDELFFDETNLETSVYENAKIGTRLKSFRVSSGESNNTTRVPVTFAIDRASDRRRQFAIDQNGVVTIRRRLDREVTPLHHLNILAFYDSVISKTATATLTVNVQDINDNAPRFLNVFLTFNCLLRFNIMCTFSIKGLPPGSDGKLATREAVGNFCNR